MRAGVRANSVDKIYTGHLCSIIVPIITSLQTVVTINGIPGVVLGSIVEPHSIKAGSSCIPHTATVTSASDKVTFGGIPAARIGDDADQGAIITGSPSVFIG